VVIPWLGPIEYFDQMFDLKEARGNPAGNYGDTPTIPKWPLGRSVKTRLYVKKSFFSS